jgi:hypothetical protein
LIAPSNAAFSKNLTREEGIFILTGEKVFTTGNWLFTEDNRRGVKR